MFGKQCKRAYFLYLSDNDWVSTRMQYLVRCYMLLIVLRGIPRPDVKGKKAIGLSGIS